MSDILHFHVHCQVCTLEKNFYLIIKQLCLQAALSQLGSGSKIVS